MSSPSASNKQEKKSFCSEAQSSPKNTVQNITNFTQNTEMLSNLNNFFIIN